jgi:spermidine/putrescine transport system substrate-binding protein
VVFYYWEDYFPKEILEAFTRETGIPVRYEFYDSEEAAVTEISSGAAYDVTVLPPEQIPRLIRENRLKPMDYARIPNFKYIPAHFRDLVFDPGNRYSIPFRWGTTGLLVRQDLVPRPITRWNDLWDPALKGKVALWTIARTMIPITLKSLGYSINTTNPAELDAALNRLVELIPNGYFVPADMPCIVPELTEERAWVAVGWAYDAFTAQKEGHTNIEYILPEDGTILWGEELVIPAASAHPRAAEALIDFLLRPENAARAVSLTGYQVPHDGLEPFLDPEILANPIVFPPNEQLQSAELSMPLGEHGDAYYDLIWERFLSAAKLPLP